MLNNELPAILGGKPIFNSFVPIIEPTLPTIEEIKLKIQDILKTRMITNHKYVQNLEKSLKEYFGVKNVIGISNCTTGLLLLGKCLNFQGEVITPSFSFSATSLALAWLNVKPIFVDIDIKKFTIDPDKITEKITSKTSAILATHIFGNPCKIKELSEIAEDYKLKLIFDSAHGAGSIYRGKKISNFGDGESFSMSPTKVLTAGEGGLITTNNDLLAEQVRIGRNYANPGDYNTSFIGFSGRMAEFSAILALKSLEHLDENVTNRQELVKVYKKILSELPGLSFQQIEADSRSSYKDFAIVINDKEFEITRDVLYEALNAENIMTRKYFSPAIHQQDAFRLYLKGQDLDLENTENLAQKILCLPIYSHMKSSKVEKICDAIKRIYLHRSELR